MFKNTHKLLTYAGLIPFVIASLLIVFSGFSLYAKHVFILYSSIILCFMSGALWGRNIENGQNSLVFLLSNLYFLVSLLSLILYLLNQSKPFIQGVMLLNSAAYIGIYLLEKHLFNQQTDYLILRKRITSIVVAIHIISVIFIQII